MANPFLNMLFIMTTMLKFVQLRFGRIAQLVERSIHIREVSGPSPDATTMNPEGWIKVVSDYLSKVNTISNISALVFGGLTILLQQTENNNLAQTAKFLFEVVSFVPLFCVPFENSLALMIKFRGFDIDLDYRPFTTGRFENIAMFLGNILMALRFETRI